MNALNATELSALKSLLLLCEFHPNIGKVIYERKGSINYFEILKCAFFLLNIERKPSVMSSETCNKYFVQEMRKT